MKSISSRSALLPRLIKLPNPISSAMIQSRMAVPNAPLCVMNPMLPFLGREDAKLRSKGT